MDLQDTKKSQKSISKIIRVSFSKITEPCKLHGNCENAGDSNGSINFS